MSQKYEKLKNLLKELFQLDQPELDFGLYRVMHAKSAEVTDFLDRDLLPQVKDAFRLYKTADKAELEKELAKAVEQAHALGADAETLPKVKELKAALQNDAVDVAALESEVYDHLFSFFRRYYSEGDFLAKRVYKQGVYAIPYEGEEVKLHWANRDQYYIKTSEYLRDYAFRLRPDNDQKPMRVHFRLADVSEGEHGNVKAAAGNDRMFILAAPGTSGHDFIGEENGELIIRFEYRPAALTDWPEADRADNSKPPAQKDLITIATKRILALKERSLAPWISELAKSHISTAGDKADYTRLEAHLRRYSARNTFDYFIHKDLRGFLRRELDFYIKHEVMHLDDVENESAPRVEQYLSKIKVMRNIAGKLIDFLGQLEDFQKKLWLKKKFVVETHYCLTLDRIPDEFYPEIAANDAQRKEWVELFAINDIKRDLTTPEYSQPLTVPFLQHNKHLVLDTRFFAKPFRDRLIARFDGLDNALSGILVNAENFQALRSLKARFGRQIDCVYADPPFNTAATEILYKNDYRDSSWLSLIADRVQEASYLMAPESMICVAIDDAELTRLVECLSLEFGQDSHVATVAVRSNPHGRAMAAGFSVNHEYAIFFANDSRVEVGRLPRNEKRLARYPNSDDKGSFTWINFRKTGADSRRVDRPRSFYPVYISEDGKVRVPPLEWSGEWKPTEPPKRGEIIVLPEDGDGTERVWTQGADRATKEAPTELEARKTNGEWQVYRKYRPNEEGALPGTWWDDAKYSATESGTKILNELFGKREVFSYPKSVFLIEDCLRVLKCASDSTVLDFFAGSGTTGHAVIALNRSDAGSRKYVLLEMGHHFDTALLPRIKKVIYATDWDDGKPNSRTTGVSQAFKYVRLESYEDALHNLEPRRTGTQQILLDSAESRGVAGFKEQYLLRYMLNVETLGSQSLLNIQAFKDPTAYKLKIKHPGSDESREIDVDLLETFNWLTGITVQHIAVAQHFAAKFERDGEKRLRLKGRIKQEDSGPWWFRTVTGATPDGRRTLVIWRKLTGEPEQDNLVLDEWFTKQGYSSKDSEFQLIYVNGDNNLENLKTQDDTWKVRLIEEDFHRLMFDMEGV